MAPETRDETPGELMSTIKTQKRILKERRELEYRIQNWIETNTHKPMPGWAQKVFEHAKYRMVLHTGRFTRNGFTMSSLLLPFYYSVINLLLWAFRVTIRFSTDDNKQVLNVAVFHKGKYFDSCIKPEEVINGHKKTT